MSSLEPDDVGPKHGGDLRVSDSDRGQVVALLSAAYAEGRITRDEHDERTQAAMDATVFDDLIPLTRDLVPLHQPIPDNRRGDGLSTVPSPPLPTVDHRSTGDSDTLIAVFGGSSRRGAWRARRKIRTFALFGGNELDFSEAVFEDSVVEINGFWFFGGCDIRVPAGVEVQDQVIGIFGGSDVKGTAPQPGGPTIVVKGVALFGGCDIKGPRRKKRDREQ